MLNICWCCSHLEEDFSDNCFQFSGVSHCTIAVISYMNYLSPPPPIILGNKKESQKEEKPAGQVTKKSSPPFP